GGQHARGAHLFRGRAEAQRAVQRRGRGVGAHPAGAAAHREQRVRTRGAPARRGGHRLGPGRCAGRGPLRPHRLGGAAGAHPGSLRRGARAAGGQTAVSARANQLLEAGLWLKMSGDLDGARRLFEQALKLDPDSIRARELLGHEMSEAEAVPEELRDVPITRTDLFSVPLPRLFQDEPPAPTSLPEEGWTAPPSDGMGNTSRFFVRSGEAAPAEARPAQTIPWGPSPLAPRGMDMGATAVVPPPPGATETPRGLDFEGDDFGITP